jgi:hypothetical protein
MKSKLLITIAENFTGGLVGFLSYQLSEEKNTSIGLLSLILGILAAIAAGIIFQPFMIDAELKEMKDRLNQLLAKTSDRMISGFGAAQLLKYGYISVPREGSSRAWLQILWQTKERYWGVIYTSPDEVVNTSIFDLGLTVLVAKARVDGVDVRRVLIVDDDAELANVMPAIIKHREAGLKIRYIKKAMIDRHPLLKTQLDQLPTYDISLSDNQVVWLLVLDDKRRLNHCELYYDEIMLNQYAEIYRLLWDASVQ